MIAFTLLLAGLALVGVVLGVRNLFTDGHRRVPTVPLCRHGEASQWR